MEEHEIIDVMYMGKPISDEPNVYKRKALLEMKQLYYLILNQYMDDIKACRGSVKIYLTQSFKKDKIDCTVPCAELRKKIKITLSKFFNI